MSDRARTTRRILREVVRRHPPAAQARTTPPRNESASTDEELLGAAAADPSALGPLYERHAKRVYRLALAILGSREEAEDLTQELFVSVCAPTLYDRDRGTVSAFLITMARSRALDRLRRRARSARLLETWHEAHPTPAPRTPFEHTSRRRTAERVRAVLAELPGAQRRVLEMAYYGGLSQSEIAADLDTPLGTVKSLSRRALLALARALGASGLIGGAPRAADRTPLGDARDSGPARHRPVSRGRNSSSRRRAA